MKKKVAAAALLFGIVAASLFLPEDKSAGEAPKRQQENTEAAAESDEADNKDWEWELLEDGTVALTKYHGMAEIVLIPHMLGGKRVTVIGAESFMECSFIKEAMIPEGVTEIKRAAFAYCWGMERVALPESLLLIGDGAFKYCYNQDENEIVTGLGSIMIPREVKYIGKGVFDGCVRLRQIEVSGKNQAFSSEDGVLFNRTKTELLAYPAAKALDKYEVPEGVCRVGDYAFCNAGLSTVKLPQSLQEIGEGACYNCKSLKTMLLPSGLKKIGAWAFLNCGFKEVAIPSSVACIGEGAFEAAYGLKAITVTAENAAYASEDGILYNKQKTELVAYPAGKEQAEFKIPSGVAVVGRSAFGTNTYLKRVLVPESVDKIEGNAFCRAGLQEIIIQNPACIIEEIRNDKKWETTISYGTKIYGYEDSTAQSYAEGHENVFKVLR